MWAALKNSILFRTYNFTELLFVVRDTGNRLSHVSKHPLFQVNGADKMCRANLFSFEP